MLINFTNHPSDRWCSEQVVAGSKYGDIIDLPFPNVSPYLGSEDVHALADEYVSQILSMKPNAVLCQGEMTLAYRVVQGLQAAGVTVLAACSERQTSETVNEKGETLRSSHFVFCGFRKY